MPPFGISKLYLCIIKVTNSITFNLFVIWQQKALSNEFMQKISTDEAWKELSGNYNWSESLLEKYQDKVDWHEVSENTNILWTIPMIQKFRNRIDWDKFSRNAETETLTEAIIDAFKDKWNWAELSENSSLELTHEFLENIPTNGIGRKSSIVIIAASMTRRALSSTRDTRTTYLLPNSRILGCGMRLSTRRKNS